MANDGSDALVTALTVPGVPFLRIAADDDGGGFHERGGETCAVQKEIKPQFLGAPGADGMDCFDRFGLAQGIVLLVIISGRHEYLLAGKVALRRGNRETAGGPSSVLFFLVVILV